MKALHPSNISDQLFNIPIYQRLFTWGEEQIKELLDDLLYEYLSNDTPSDYHIGVLTVKHDASSKRLDLVDGQQRFTVMMLMGCVMKEHYIEWKRNFLKYNNELRLDFRARPDDRKYMNYLIDGGDLVDSINETMNNGINFISEYLKEKNFSSHYKRLSSGIKKRQICVEGFCQYVYEHLSFFLTYLPDDYNARQLNKHFESMNSTGRNLENHEILKVQLLKKIRPEEYGVCVEMWNQASRMEQTICPLSDPEEKQMHIDTIIKARTTDDFSISSQEDSRKPENASIKALLDDNGGANMQIEEGSNNNVSTFRSFLNFTDYLLLVLYLMLDDESKAEVVYQHFFNPNNLLKTCEKYIGKEENKIQPSDYIKTIYRYRFFFDYYILRIDGNGSYRLLSSESSEHDKLEQYEAMLYADSSRYTYYRWIPFILKYVSDDTNELSNERLLENLKDYDSTIEEHKIVEFSKLEFDKFNNYYFRRLDYYLWEFFIDNINQNNADLSKVLPKDCQIETVAIKAIKDYKFHQYNSVEHFHPRSEREQKEHWEKDDKDSFGNLALISDYFNLTQSDNALALKFARVKNQIEKNNLESIKLALMYYSANGKSENWTVTLMKDHKDLMVKFLESTYIKDD